MKRNTSGLWRGGSPGRPPGTPNKATVEMRRFVQGVLAEAFADPQLKPNLVRAIVELNLDAKVLRMLFEYAYGRVPYALDLAGVQPGPKLEEIIAGTYRPADDDQDDGDEQGAPLVAGPEKPQ